MSFNPQKSFEVTEDGIIIEGGPLITGGSSSPLEQPLPPIACIYIRTNGEIWTFDLIKWRKVSAFNFSFFRINDNVEIPPGQQMIVEGSIELTNTAGLGLDPDGSLVLK